jgi:predicted ester cyclase
MSAKQNKEILLRSMEEYAKGNYEAYYEIIAPNHVYISGGKELKGKQAFVDLDKTVRTAFPDSQYTVEDVIEKDDKVAWRETFRGTFTGKFGSTAPTGNKVVLPAIVINRFADGKIVETWVERDNFSMLQQMGIMKPRG